MRPRARSNNKSRWLPGMKFGRTVTSTCHRMSCWRMLFLSIEPRHLKSRSVSRKRWLMRLTRQSRRFKICLITRMRRLGPKKTRLQRCAPKWLNSVRVMHRQSQICVKNSRSLATQLWPKCKKLSANTKFTNKSSANVPKLTPLRWAAWTCPSSSASYRRKTTWSSSSGLESKAIALKAPSCQRSGMSGYKKLIHSKLNFKGSVIGTMWQLSTKKCQG